MKSTCVDLLTAITHISPVTRWPGSGTTPAIIGRVTNAIEPAFEGALMKALAAQTPARDRASEG